MLGVLLAAAVAVAPPVPVRAQQAIRRSVPTSFAYVPRRVPRGWRYHAWDAGRETPGLFPRGRGLNVWFSTPPYRRQFCAGCRPREPEGAGFHVYADGRCSTRRATARFRIGQVVVAWESGFEDALAWRCVRAGRRLLRLSVSFAGLGTGPMTPPRVAARHALVVARMLASARSL